MALMNAAQKQRAWRWWALHRATDPDSVPCRFNKTQLGAAADAADAWVEANQASFVASLAGTAFAGAGSSADEKLRLFLAVLLARNNYDLEALS